MDLGELRHLLSALTDSRHHLGDRMENGREVGKEGSGGAAICLGEPERCWTGVSGGQSGTATTASSGDPVKLRGERIDGAEAWQLRTSSPVLAQRHAAPSELVNMGPWGSSV